MQRSLLIFLTIGVLFHTSGCASYRAYKISKNELIEERMFTDQSPPPINAWSDGHYIGAQFNFGATDIIFKDWKTILRQIGSGLFDIGIAVGTAYSIKAIKNATEDNQSAPSSKSITEPIQFDAQTVIINQYIQP